MQWIRKQYLRKPGSHTIRTLMRPIGTSASVLNSNEVTFPECSVSYSSLSYEAPGAALKTFAHANWSLECKSSSARMAEKAILKAFNFCFGNAILALIRNRMACFEWITIIPLDFPYAYRVERTQRIGLRMSRPAYEKEYLFSISIFLRRLLR